MITTHLLALNTTDAKDKLWASCSCGWRTDAVNVAPNTDTSGLQVKLAAEARGHIREIAGIEP